MAEIKVPVEAFQPTPHHLDVLNLFDKCVIENKSDIRFFYLNWHRRARKSTLMINLLIKEAVRNPNSMYVYVAPTYKQAKSIIWRDPNMLQRYLPHDLVDKQNETELYVKFYNGSYLRIVGGDDPDSVRGIDCEGVCIDEWSLVKSEIWEEIFSPIIRQKKSRWAVFAFTPKGKNHAYEIWNACEKWDDWHRSLLRADVSGLIPPVELEKMRTQYRVESLYYQELMCEFIDDDDKVLITYKDIENLNRQVWQGKDDPRRLISLDPSEGGDDCVFKVLEGYNLIGELTLKGEKNTMNIVHEACKLSVKYECDDFCVDAIGVGAGISDRLKQIGKRVIKIKAQERLKLRNPDKFYNLRAEIWWEAMELITTHKIPPITCPKIKDQLTGLHYDIDINGRIKMERKREFKKRIKRSPDDADAYVNGLYYISKVKRFYYTKVEGWRSGENPLRNRRKVVFHGSKGGW